MARLHVRTLSPLPHAVHQGIPLARREQSAGSAPMCAATPRRSVGTHRAKGEAKDASQPSLCSAHGGLAALALGGCGSSGADKAGGERASKPTVLTLANANGDSVELEPFANAVERRSGGTLKIVFKNHWRPGQADAEAGLIRDVKAGKADLGWAGTRAFDDVGVPAFDALHAPLLIDSLPLERTVLESPLVPAMLGGLKPAGVTGLGILPGPLRRPLGVAPLVKPQDYARRDDRAAALAGGGADAGRARRARRAAPGHGHDRWLRRRRAAAQLDRRQRLRPDREPPDRQRGAVAAPGGAVRQPEGARRPGRSPARRADRRGEGGDRRHVRRSAEGRGGGRQRSSAAAA